MRERIVFAAVMLCCVFCPEGRAQTSAAHVDQLSWIAGCWRGDRPGKRTIDEHWMAPSGRTMLGMSRTVRADSTIEFEHLEILERGGQLVYHAEPSGQAPADFHARSASDSVVVFENPAHDFPQRIIYRRRGSDSLVARIEGTMNGRTRGVDFPYARVPCL